MVALRRVGLILSSFTGLTRAPSALRSSINAPLRSTRRTDPAPMSSLLGSGRVASAYAKVPSTRTRINPPATTAVFNHLWLAFVHHSGSRQRAGWAADARFRVSTTGGRGSAICRLDGGLPADAYRFLETAACPRSCGVLAPLISRRAKPAASAVSAA